MSAPQPMTPDEIRTMVFQHLRDSAGLRAKLESVQLMLFAELVCRVVDLSENVRLIRESIGP